MREKKFTKNTPKTDTKPHKKKEFNNNNVF